MGNPSFVFHLLLITALYSICTSCATSFSNCNPITSSPLLPIHLLRTDSDAIEAASTDYGNLVRQTPSAVLYPSSISDIINLIKLSNNCSTPFPISARGAGHSVSGQPTVQGGVVVEMSSLTRTDGNGIRVSSDPSLGLHYVDVGGHVLWIDVLLACLDYGLAPVSWTDYLYLSVGGTLSNAGISGQSFLHGPQISNVLELDVITGKGDFLTCSKDMNSDLFFAVLGGLGQFGIITRARIILHKAPSRAKWMRLFYSDFSMFSRDQEHLISQGGTINGPDYVEGTVITHHSPPNNWRSSFYTDSQLDQITSLLESNEVRLVYTIEVVKYYDDRNAHTIDQEIEALVRDLSFIPGFIFKKDVSLLEFLNRVGNGEIRSPEEQSEAHPWLNLFVPKSRIHDFNAAVVVNILGGQNHSSLGPILFYPFNRQKWDDRMSGVTPEEDIFYTLGLLHTSVDKESSDKFDNLNKEILEVCEKGGMGVKQYLPLHKSKEDWVKHFGPKWDTFQLRKTTFDPKLILSTALGIFLNAPI